MAVSTEVITSPLQQMAATTATDYWNDSSSVEELTYAVARGATGATSNPTIVGEVLKKGAPLARPRSRADRGNPAWTEDEVTWKLIEEISVRGSEILLPVFEREGHRKGRLSIQTNPKYYRDAERITEQALRFAALAPNMQVKVPATGGGIRAVEDVTAPACHQRDRQLHGAAGARGRRGRRARARAPRGGGRRLSLMSPVVR